MAVEQGEGRECACGVHAQRFNAANVRAGKEFQVNTTTPRLLTQPAVTGLAGGGFVVVWRALGPGGNAGVYAQLHDATGQRLEYGIPRQFLLSRRADFNIGRGGAAQRWLCRDLEGAAARMGRKPTFLGQRYNADGTKAGSKFTVNTAPAKPGGNPVVAGLMDGGFAVSWVAGDQKGQRHLRPALQGQWCGGRSPDREGQHHHSRFPGRAGHRGLS